MHIGTCELTPSCNVLLQLAIAVLDLQVFVNATCYMFDLLQQDVGILGELRSLLQDASVVKVVHDCRQDSAALFYQTQTKLDNIFDTQVWRPCLRKLGELVTLSLCSVVILSSCPACAVTRKVQHAL